MKNFLNGRSSLALAVLFVLIFANVFMNDLTLAQSRRKPETPPQKKNQRPGEAKPEDEKAEEIPKDIVNAPPEAEIVKVITNLVNIETVVIHKKSRQIVGNLKQANFAVFEDGVQQQITNFATPEAKLNVAVVIEYS